jgi:hypothetical protein
MCSIAAQRDGWVIQLEIAKLFKIDIDTRD